MEGTAKVTVRIDGWNDAEVKPATKTLKVLAPKQKAATLPVSERVVRMLNFADKKARLAKLSFTPDGKRLLATGMQWYQSWDAATWKELVRVEPLVGITRGEMHTTVSADGSTVAHVGLHVERENNEIEGKLVNRLRMTGQLHLHDSTSAKPKWSKQYNDRGPGIVTLSPDGKHAVVVFELNGVGNELPMYTTEFWDLGKGTSKVLFDQRSGAVFSPDGRTVYVSTTEQTSATDIKSTLYVIDTATLKTVKEIPAAASTVFGIRAISPDDKILLAMEANIKTRKFAAVFLDAGTFKELDRIPATVEFGTLARMEHTEFSVDSSRVAFRLGKDTIQLWDSVQKKVVRTIKDDSPGVLIGTLELNRQGTMLASIYPQDVSLQQAYSRTGPSDPGQASVLLHDLTDIKRAPERIALPAGATSVMVFSPDGKTLTVGLHGKVCIVDATMKK